MSFLDLPTDWPETPLTDPTRAADVVDLCLTIGDRRRGLLKVIFGDSNHHFHGCVDVDLRDHHNQLHLTDPRSVLEPIVAALRSAPGKSVLLALGRPGPPDWQAIDNEWAEAATTVCTEADVHLLSFYVATPDHIRRLELPVHATPDHVRRAELPVHV